MSQIRADLDALSAFQQSLVQALPILQQAAEKEGPKIQSTLTALKQACKTAIRAEEMAYAKLEKAQEELHLAERRTDEQNRNRPEGSAPVETPLWYQAEVRKKEEIADYAVAVRVQIQQDLDSFEACARDHRRRQEETLDQIRSLIRESGQFFQQYIALLVEAKKQTSLSALSDSSNSSGTSIR